MRSKFRIPTYDESENEDQEGTRPHIPVPLQEGSGSGSHDFSHAMDREAVSLALPGSGVIAAKLAAGRSLETLLAQLGNWRAQGASLEVQYTGGQRITPDRFLPGLSRGSHAVFAVDEPGGTSTLAAVAWDAISAVVVRGLKRVPEDGQG